MKHPVETARRFLALADRNIKTFNLLATSDSDDQAIGLGNWMSIESNDRLWRSFLNHRASHFSRFRRGSSLNAVILRFSAETAIRVWAINKSGELARESLYFVRASDAFSQGDLRRAKITGLEAVEHVTAESPRLDLLLGRKSQADDLTAFD